MKLRATLKERQEDFGSFLSVWDAEVAPTLVKMLHKEEEGDEDHWKQRSMESCEFNSRVLISHDS